MVPGEENVVLYRRFVDELINNRNLAVIDTMSPKTLSSTEDYPDFPRDVTV